MYVLLRKCVTIHFRSHGDTPLGPIIPDDILESKNINSFSFPAPTLFWGGRVRE